MKLKWRPVSGRHFFYIYPIRRDIFQSIKTNYLSFLLSDVLCCLFFSYLYALKVLATFLKIGYIKSLRTVRFRFSSVNCTCRTRHC